MKKNFKRIICTALALCLLCALAVTAVAAAPAKDGVYNVVNVNGKLVPKTADNKDIASTQVDIDGKNETFYPGAERFTMTFTPETGKQHLVFLLKGTESVPSKSNIFYIDQKDDKAGSFDLFPMQMSADNYTVWMTVTGGGAAKKMGSFTYHQSYVLGRVTKGDIAIDTEDARLVLNYAVGNTDLDEQQKLAANVTKPTRNDNDIDTEDARLILNYAVGNIENFN